MSTESHNRVHELRHTDVSFKSATSSQHHLWLAILALGVASGAGRGDFRLPPPLHTNFMSAFDTPPPLPCSAWKDFE